MIFINQSFGHLSSDTVNQFIENGEEIVVIAGSDVEMIADSKNLRIIKCVSYNRKNTFTRFFSWILFFIQSIFYVTKYRSNHKEIFIVSNPPILFFIPLIFRKKTYFLLVYDLYPDVLKIKFKKNYYKTFKFWEKVNKIVFANAKIVFTIGENMKNSISEYVEKSKIEVIYNWANKNYDSVDLNNERQLFPELKEKILVLYSGNMGATHDFSVVCEYIKMFEEINSKVFFLFVGRGSKLSEIKKFVNEKKLSNVGFVEKLPFSEYVALLKISKFGIVTLDKEMETFSVPSKTFSYLNAGLPVLNFTSMNSEVYTLIAKHNIGFNVNCNQITESCKELNKIIESDEIYMDLKKNSSKVSSILFSSENTGKYLELIKEVRNKKESNINF